MVQNQLNGRMIPSGDRAPFVTLGAKVVEGFGFGDLFEQFRERFGQRLADILLGAIGLAVFSSATYATFQFLILPVLDFIESDARTGAGALLMRLVTAIALLTGLAWGFAKMVEHVFAWRLRKTANTLAVRLEDIQQRANVGIEPSELSAEIDECFEDAIKVLRRQTDAPSISKKDG